MTASRGETRSYRRRLRGAAALLVLAAALAALLIGSRAHSDSAPPALTTSTTAMMASDGKSAEAAWPALTDPGWPPPDFTDPLERPRTPARNPWACSRATPRGRRPQSPRRIRPARQGARPGAGFRGESRRGVAGDQPVWC